jgi:hypothetical protein
VQTQLLSSADVIIGAIADPRDSAKSIKAQSSKLKGQGSKAYFLKLPKITQKSKAIHNNYQ